MNKKLAIIILTYNSEKIIKETITQAKKISKNIIIVDSYSTDKTIKIVNKLKCKVLRRKFINYSDQRNFIIKKCNNIYEWQLHLDSDEILSEKLIKNIKIILKNDIKNRAYIVRRQIYFLNKKLLFGGNSNWHLRLFPSKTTICERKKYDQHFISKLKAEKIKGSLNDRNTNNLSKWIESHNKWSSLQAEDKDYNNSHLVQPKLFGNNIERTRLIKNIIFLLPLGIKGFVLFFIKYFLLLGFLDGKIGFMYCFFNSFWFHTLVEKKKYELINIKYK
jgi:glycosyltransferase involved in cell wall biosynthesis